MNLISKKIVQEKQQKNLHVEKRQQILRRIKFWSLVGFIKERSTQTQTDSLLLYVSISELSGTLTCVNTTTVHLFPCSAAPVFVFHALPLVLAEPILVSQVVVEKMEGVVLAPLSHGFLLALRGAEEEGLHCHEALADQALGAAGALEALRLGVPVVIAVGNPLGLRLHRNLAGRAFHSVALHVARLADRLVLLHDVSLSGEDAVTFKTAEVLQMPVLALSLSVLITEDQLITASTARLLAVSIVASTVQLALLPEVDHVHQQLVAGATHEACWVPHLVVAGPLSVDSWLAQTHRLLAVTARKVLLW